MGKYIDTFPIDKFPITIYILLWSFYPVFIGLFQCKSNSLPLTHLSIQ